MNVTPPGLLCPSTVTWLCASARAMSPPRSITPDTRKTMIRGQVDNIAARNEPGPDPLSVVTTITTPPRPPVVSVPKPCAPGNAGRA